MRDETSGIDVQHCPVCQHALRIDAYFCAHCGHTLTDYVASPERPTIISSAARLASHGSELKRVGWLFGLLLFSSFLLGTIGRGNFSPWSETITSGIDALIVLVFVGMRHRELHALFNFPQFTRRHSLELLAVVLVFVVGVNLYFALIQYAGTPMVRVSTVYQKAAWPVWSMFVLICIMPAVFEELAFRGVIQTALGHVFNEREAWLIQAALFSILHLMPIIFPSHFLMGLCFGYMRLRTKSLYPGMILHALWNAFVLSQELYWL
ncbi:MAG: CPBP family intramembrane metalloprotease [Gammaproteobacteria bacterium]|nr:CPBP family intramembrane metalloprotease [Gammaproteobacteria bacterium]